MERDLVYLLDILLSARLIQQFTQDVDEEIFRFDQMRQDAVIRRIQIIGEATRHISPEFRKAHPEIPWQQMAGMRNKLTHEYRRVDLDQVWNVTQQDIPVLIMLLTPLVPPEGPDEET
jgi:uncharacterized protein with HEPN domain